MAPGRADRLKTGIDHRWLKASVAGSMWAASEIVIGSFLHNLRVPFSGSILTAIGIVLLISLSHKWKEKGLFWRTGLICALMKTLSPSAVIFGPMIAIMSEALLMEFTVILLGRNVAGYIAGAVLAMSWSLVQRVLTLVVFYGNSIIEVYTELADMAEKQTGIQVDMAWLPLLILLAVNVILGIITAVTGLKLGRRTAKETGVGIKQYRSTMAKNSFNDPDQKTPYSLAWLFVNLSLFVAAMLVLNYSPLVVWLVIVPVITGIWIMRYRRAMRQLMNPKFWIFFIIITIITSFVFTRAREGEDILKMGLIEGLRMNFRAATIIIGFSVLGSELYNPKIRQSFARTSFRNLPLALELAVDSLPLFIASIPGFRTIVKNPVSALSNVVVHAGIRLHELQKKNSTDNRVFIISGKKGEGKTSLAAKLAGMLRENTYRVGGILTERVMDRGETSGYDLLDIEAGNKIKFLRKSHDDTPEKIGSYSIYPAALDLGRNILCGGSARTITVIDEVGRLELGGGGWSECLSLLLNRNEGIVILTVRDSLLEKVIKKWGIVNFHIINISGYSVQEAFDLIRDPVS
ncbi:MAG: nucleoside-triphosphatase [Bacteroidales bacterium]|nr:nucleoside-triphosphatase [Bacteroidales bacterium]